MAQRIDTGQFGPGGILSALGAGLGGVAGQLPRVPAGLLAGQQAQQTLEELRRKRGETQQAKAIFERVAEAEPTPVARFQALRGATIETALETGEIPAVVQDFAKLFPAEQKTTKVFHISKKELSAEEKAALGALAKQRTASAKRSTSLSQKDIVTGFNFLLKLLKPDLLSTDEQRASFNTTISTFQQLLQEMIQNQNLLRKGQQPTGITPTQPTGAVVPTGVGTTETAIGTTAVDFQKLLEDITTGTLQ